MGTCDRAGLGTDTCPRRRSRSRTLCSRSNAGVVQDEFQVFRWDGTRRDIESWNVDQDLRSSMRNSTVWVYQQFARAIGERQERRYLQSIAYGNADPSGGIDRFWLDGNLRISAEEQVSFLRRLHRNALPFRAEHQRLVKDVMIVEAGRQWILRAKTGWQAQVQPQVGWWVGWVEWPQGSVFFASISTCRMARRICRSGKGLRARS